MSVPDRRRPPDRPVGSAQPMQRAPYPEPDDIPMASACALLILVAAVVLLVRRVEVRLVLLGAGLLLATLAGRPLALADAFAEGMVAAMVAPICAAMGFAAVLNRTGCDRHLVHLLLVP